MFSATKYVVAGVIVALFGGFLLSGVLTQQNEEPQPAVGASASASASPETQADASPASDPAVRPDLLPGVELDTEEVEPGVFRVAGDGLRDLSGSVYLEYFPAHFSGKVIAGLDGSIWWLGNDNFFRLGEEHVHAWPTDLFVNGADIEVGPEGTMWAAPSEFSQGSGGVLRSFDGDSWTTRRKGPAKGTISGVELQQDGTVWVAEKTGKQGTTWRVVRLDADGWEILPGKIELHRSLDMSVAEDGGSEVWVMSSGQRLQRHDGRRWHVQSVPDTPLTGRLKNAQWATVGPDGKALWVLLRNGREFARFDGSDWEVYDTGDRTNRARGAFFEAARDGSLWFNPLGGPDIACDGVANVDGGSMRYFLKDHCVYAMDIAPDGSVWLQAGEDRGDPGLLTSEARTIPVHTYVITPEAVAAIE